MDIYQHINLLERYDRTVGIFNVLNKFVERGDVLIDAGSGSGLISFLSLRAGADFIYAVERDPIIDLSEKMAADNQMQHQMSFIRSDLSGVERTRFEKKITGLIAFIYMNDPRRDEQQHKLVFDLIDKLDLKGVKLVPNRVKYQAYLAHIPTYDLMNHRNQIRKRIQNLEKRYNLNFDSFSQEVETSIDYSFFPQRNALGNYVASAKTILSNSVEWMEVDYQRGLTKYPEQIGFKMLRDGEPNCVVWIQDLMYNDLVVFNNESISFIANPTPTKRDAHVEVSLNAAWRQANLLYVK